MRTVCAGAIDAQVSSATCRCAVAAIWPGRSDAGSSEAAVTTAYAYGSHVDEWSPPQLPERVKGWPHAARAQAAKSEKTNRIREPCRGEARRSTPVGRLLLFVALAGEARAAGRRGAHADADHAFQHGD